MFRVAVVLVDFQDQQMTRTTADFETLFFSLGVMPTMSVREYYRDVSNNNVDFVGEVVGPFRMPHPVTYYANGDAGRTPMPPNSRTLAADALAAADSHINFAQYDNDHNGVVDAFVVVHAGRGAEQTHNRVNDIWSLKWVLPRRAFVDGVSVYAFLTIPEDARIGVCSHELGHLVFGWPDLYDTDYSSQGIGNWCLMAGGAWGGNPSGTRPCHPSAWCKANQGWVNVVNATTNGALTLRDVKTIREVRRLWTNGDLTSQEYFLIENRQQTGFDASLPGAGLFSMYPRRLPAVFC
jgi:immune inhibitor A